MARQTREDFEKGVADLAAAALAAKECLIEVEQETREIETDGPAVVRELTGKRVYTVTVWSSRAGSGGWPR